MYRLLMLLPAVLSDSALAHPGEHHSGLFVTLGHLLSEPDHLALAAIAVVVAVAGARAWTRRAAAQRSRSHDSR